MDPLFATVTDSLLPPKSETPSLSTALAMESHFTAMSASPLFPVVVQETKSPSWVGSS